MRRTLLLLLGAAVLTLPAVALARGQATRPAPGYLVVQDAATDGGVKGSPVVTVVVQGFVVGRIAQEGKVQLYHLTVGTGSLASQATGINVSRRGVAWHGVAGTEFSGSDFRFRAVGGVWRVVVYGAGISLYAGGEGKVALHGSTVYPTDDGRYSIDGRPFSSLPAGMVKRSLGTK